MPLKAAEQSARKRSRNNHSRPEESPASEVNLQVFNSSEVARYYAALDYLTPCERLIFDEYLRPGMSILDLGVGGGRTTPYLSATAARYVGVDYAAEMIAGCRKRFPQLEFQVANAADLSAFAASSFDAVVMAFNGIDSVIPDAARYSALREIRRFLKPGGVLIFSSHNPRSIWVRPSWNPRRMREIAERVVSTDSFLLRPMVGCLTAARITLALAQAGVQSLGRGVKRTRTRTFWRGEGYWTDPAHGGVLTRLATPKNVSQELGKFQFHRLRVLGDDYPRTSHSLVTDWYYYVFAKSPVPAEK